MTLPIYAGQFEITCEGQVSISGDRITHIDVVVKANLPQIERIALKIPKEKKVSKDTDYKFSLVRLSKHDLLHRNHKLTHQIVSEDFTELFKRTMYFRLTKFQSLKLNYQLGTFYLQSQEFKTHFYKYIIGLIIGSAATLWITHLTKQPCPELPNDNATNSPPNKSSNYIAPSTMTDTQFHQSIHKNVKLESVLH